MKNIFKFFAIVLILYKINYGTNKDIQGMTLILKNDSTYFYDTCGILLDGYWSVRNDSLLMKVDNIRYKNDSINKIRKPEKRADFLKYAINDNILYGFIKNNDGLRINKLLKKN
jgi:hypothetical protein